MPFFLFSMAEGVDGAAVICCFMTSDYFVSYFTVVYLALATSDRSLLWFVEDSKAEWYKRLDYKSASLAFERKQNKDTQTIKHCNKSEWRYTIREKQRIQRG